MSRRRNEPQMRVGRAGLAPGPRPGGRAILPVVGVILALIALTQVAEARTWYVLPDSTGDAPFIQAAIDSATDGDTILIAPGDHPGDESGYIRIRQKSLSLIGEAGWEATQVPALAVRESAGVGLQGLDFGWGFTIVNVGNVSMRQCHAGPSANSSAVQQGFPDVAMRIEIVDCVFEQIHNYQPEVYGGALELVGGRSYTAVVRGCVFRDNSAAGLGGAIRIEEAGLGDEIEVVNNVFIRNSAPRGGAIYVKGFEAPVLITRNTFVGNRSGDGAVYLAGEAHVTHNIFAWNDCFGLWDNTLENYNCSCNLYWENWRDAYDQQWFGICVNMVQAVANPLFCGRRADDLRLAESSPALPANYPPELHAEGCDGIIGGLGIGCTEVPVLDASWGEIKHRFARE